MQRDFHDEDKEQYAFYQDIKFVGSPESLEPPESLWGRIAVGLEEAGLARHQTSIRHERVPDRVRGLMRVPERKILALFDEADAFLSADADKGFQVLSGIKELMESSDRRFKVVFAGLHNVRRFSSIPNQPLAHLGTPVVVGPLHPRDANDLIRTPMEAIGFKLADDGVVLRVLSITNYHPGLIQLFCHRLVDKIRGRRSAVPPYVVTVEDIEATYRDAEVRKEFKNRFLWTLDLDKRYGVIARAMVIDQMEQHDGFADTYSPQGLAKLASGWWNSEFQNMSSDRFSTYLDELVELGVLSKSSENRFRLRSPNVVRLLGTKEDVETWLLEKTCNDSVIGDGVNAAEQSHPRLQREPPVFSPLTNGQLNRLGIGRTGINLILGGEATGLGKIAQTFETLAGNKWGQEFTYRHIELPLGATFSRVTEACRRLKALPAGGLVISIRSAEQSKNLVDLLRTAANGKEILGVKAHSWCRVVFLAGPECTLALCELSEEERIELENRVTTTPLGRWTKSAVSRWLEDQEIPSNRELLETILGATGGYWHLIEAFMTAYRQSKSKSALAIAQDLSTTLNNWGSPQATSFRASLGLNIEPAVSVYRELCRLSTSNEQLPLDDAIALIADESGMSRETVNHGIFALESMAIIDRDSDCVTLEPLARRILTQP